MSTVPIRKLTAEEYLAIERLAEFKSEFYRGEMFAMAGASTAHSLIQANLIWRLSERLAGTPCRAMGSDQRVHISITGLYTYPDVVVFCHPPQYLDAHSDTLLNPKVLFEILSDSSEEYDRGTKAHHYLKIESLREFVLVSQKQPLVQVYQRLDNGDWLLHEESTLGGSLSLESIGIVVPLSEIYQSVTLPDSDPVKLADPEVRS